MKQVRLILIVLILAISSVMVMAQEPPEPTTRDEGQAAVLASRNLTVAQADDATEASILVVAFEFVLDTFCDDGLWWSESWHGIPTDGGCGSGE